MLAPTSGKHVLGHQVIVGYQAQESTETMPPDSSAFNIVKSAHSEASDKEVRAALGSFGFSGESVDKPCSVLSGGEKIRLAFARLFIRPPNLLILDEPTTHLDLQGRMMLESSLQEYAGTVCLVSHDIEFVRKVANSIVAMEPPGIRKFSGGFDYYISKRDDFSEQAPDVPAPKNTAPDPTAGMSKKEARKLRAELRQADKSGKRGLETKVRDAERRVETLEAQQAEWAAKLSDPDAQNHESINRQLKSIQADLRIWNREWEQAVDALSNA